MARELDVRRRRGLTWSVWRGAGLTELPPLSSVAYARTRKPNGLLMDFGAHVNGRAAASDRERATFFGKIYPEAGEDAERRLRRNPKSRKLGSAQNDLTMFGLHVEERSAPTISRI